MKRNLLIKMICAGAVVLTVSGCEKVLFKKEIAGTDPQTNFDYLWEECDTKYSYFEVKNVDWDQAYTKYSGRIYPEMTDDSLFHVLGDMLNELKDDHTNLFSDLNISFYGLDNKKPDNFDWQLIQKNYLSEDYYISGPFAHDFLANDQVGYIRFASFSGEINWKNLDFILERYKDTKGLILDLRENGGGLVTDIFALFSRFVDEETLLFYSRIKNGSGHNDFSEAKPAYVYPAEDPKYIGKKVMVLVDRGTYSAGSFTSLATKALPNMVLIGDTTGGGLGLPNGGQLPNGWTYRFSITQTLDLNQNAAYENGVPPDITAAMDWSDLTKDEIIERALQEILQ